MAITLNHTIVPAHDKEASAKLFAKIFGLNYDGAMSLRRIGLHAWRLAIRLA